MKPGLLLLIVHLFEFRWYVANRFQEPLVVEPSDPAQCGESTSSTLLLGPSFRRTSVLYRPIRGLSRNGVKNYSNGPCVTFLE